MFGENLTVSDLDESKIHVGDIYKVGNALVQITQPREPCFKLGVKFNTQAILKQFISHGLPGTYVRILETGFVKTGDTFYLVKRNENALTIAQLFNLIFSKNKNHEFIKKALNNDALPLKKRNELKKFLD